MAHNVQNVGLKLNIEVLTAGNVAEFVNGILEFLLYQRRQIPFVYKTYKYYIEKWAEQAVTATAEEKEQESFKNYQVQQQRSKAKETKDAISDMRELIRNAFKNSAVRSLRFLFGASQFMPKESYTIHVPSISGQHYCEHHAMPHGQINQALLTLLTCEELYTLFSTEMVATNIFLELELAAPEEQRAQFNAAKLFPKDVLSQLPRSCKNVHLHLQHETASAELQCCKELTIYQDFVTFNLDSKAAVADECNKKTEQDCSWWQSDVIVRGFRSSNQKAHELWSD